MNKIKLKIGGMHCATCVNTIETALAKKTGIKSSNVNLSTENATIVYDPEKISEENIKIIIQNQGYTVITDNTKKTPEKNYEEQVIINAKKRMYWCWSITIPIMLWMLLEMITGKPWPNKIIFEIGMLLLTTPVLFIIGLPTLKSAFNSIKILSANMDALIAIGTIVSYFTGIFSFFTPIINYSPIAAMIIAFHLTGKYIETKAKGKAGSAIKKLLELGAKNAHILIDGKEKKINIDNLKVNDIMIVRPGEKIPTDGIIIKGSSTINESMATGEAMPVVKNINDSVIGATINQEGLLHIKATKIGKDTFLSQIIEMVEECQTTKVPIQKFADKITSYFVPTVIIISILTFIIWIIFPTPLTNILIWAQKFIPWVNPNLEAGSLAIIAAVAVLVIACPCALGLATPTALMVGSGIGAANGILIKEGSAIQIMKDINIIVFDKTGTLTKGKPEVTDIICLNEAKQNNILLLAASVESGSEHPLSRAIINKAKEQQVTIIPPENFKNIVGQGAKATINDKEVLVGNKKLIETICSIDEIAKKELLKLENEAKTTILIAENKQLIGIIAVADPLKEDAIKTIHEIKNLGIKTAILTGDNYRTAEAVAKKLGINKVLSEVLPNEKVNEIKHLQKKLGIVAMVGDGINDAPALTQANVGIALGAGTDIAIEASNVTLVSKNLTAVVKAIQLSKKTFLTIKQNLYWAYLYNVLAIPMAILGLLHPVIAEIAMASSSISVVINANLLKRRSLNI